MRAFRLSDAEFVERVRRWTRRRRWHGGILLALGLICACAAIWVSCHLQDRAYDFLLENADWGDDAELRQPFGEVAFGIGYRIGFLLAQAAMVGAIGIVAGITMLFFRDRKSELLLKTWDALPADSHTE
jgi:hypothetical protein